MHASLAPKPRAIEAILEPKGLADLDLSKELYDQYIRAKQLLADADDEPLNQKAQTINSIVAVLGTITKVRTQLYSAERLKKLESCLIATLQDFPEIQERFMQAYQEMLDAE